MKLGQPTGLQVAFLVYAVLLLAVPATNAIVRATALDGLVKVGVETGLHLVLVCLLVLAVSPLRRMAVSALTRTVAPRARLEVGGIAVASIALAYGTAAGLALAAWFQDGQAGVERMIVNVDRDWAYAFSGEGLTRLCLAVVLGPVVEEVLFRGFIYRAFEVQWGWAASMFATSILFGLYHPHFWSSFACSVLFVCLLRRTGSLWAPILVHMFFNLMLWWPLLGQYVFPHGVPLGQMSTWWFHGACLIFSALALPTYVWMSRDRSIAAAPTVLLESHGALQK